MDNDSTGDDDGSGPRSVTAYTEAERETLRRCKKGEPVSAADLLMAVSTSMLVMQEWLNNVYELAPPGSLSDDIWDNLNNIFWELPNISEICQRWRAEYTGKPERKTVEVRPVAPSYEFVIFKDEVIEEYEELAAAVNELGISDLERKERMAALREFANTTLYHLPIIKNAYARDFPDEPPL